MVISSKMYTMGYLAGWFVIYAGITTSVSEDLRTERIIDSFEAVEAKQGVAVDHDALYVISNHAIGKYDKFGFKKLGQWECPEGKPLTHLNSGIVYGGKLYCAHSNYPNVPMTSSIEIWNPKTMEHIGNHSFGIMQGSLTWIDRKDGFWYACFAHYRNQAKEPNRDPSWTSLVKLDDEWGRIEGWVFPDILVEKFGDYSSSGGAFGPDGKLYVTGHDNRELYVVTIPNAGSTLEFLGSIPIRAEGQAFVFDPIEDWKLYSILKSERIVFISQLVPNDRL